MIPGVGALCAAIFIVLRDHSAYIRAKESQQNQQTFSLGITSHMAKVAFDNHVAFCEKYMKAVQNTVDVLWAEGASESAMELSNNFFKIRMQYSTWITDEITNQLKDFEEALFKIGSNLKLFKSYTDKKSASILYDESENLWEKVLGRMIDKKNIPDENLAIECIKNRVRNILGIKELIELRGLIIKKAIENMASSD